MLSVVTRSAAAGFRLRLPALTNHFLQRSGTTLTLDGTAIRLSGANMYWVGLNDNAPATGSNPAYPSHAMIDDGFASATALGANLARVHTVGISVGYSFSIMTLLNGANNPVFNEAAFEPIDYAIKKAGDHGIKLMVPLSDNWRYFHGGKWNFVHFRAGQIGDGGSPIMDTKADLSKNTANDYIGPGNEQDAENQFFYESLIISDFKKYISHVLNHVNQYTGVALKNDPTIAIWETGNEIYKASEYPAWTATIADYIKNLAPNQLVADGSAASGLATANAPGLNYANVDIVGGHYYTQNNPLTNLSSQLGQDAQAAYTAGKAFIVGEYPWSNSGSASFRASIEANNSITGDMFWSLLPHLDNGAPQIHGNGYGADDAPLHVPGANSTENSGVSAITTHIATMTGGTPGAPPAATPNRLRSAAVASSNAPISAYGAGATAASGSPTAPNLAIDNSVAAEGSNSVRLTTTSASNPYVYVADPANGAAVSPGQVYTATVAARQGTGNISQGSAHISWFDSNGSYIGGGVAVDGAASSLSTSSFTLLTATGTSPANAASAVPQFQTAIQTNVGAVAYLDQWGIFAGNSVSSWTAP